MSFFLPVDGFSVKQCIFVSICTDYDVFLLLSTMHASLEGIYKAFELGFVMTVLY